MIINVFNFGVKIFMVDFEDSNIFNWQNIIQGQINFWDVIWGDIMFEDKKWGKLY